LTDSGRLVLYRTQRPFHSGVREEPNVADPSSYPGTPRWLRICGIAVGITGLLLVVLVHGAGWRHHDLPFTGRTDRSATQESGR
jgi:hypothetical protein